MQVVQIKIRPFRPIEIYEVKDLDITTGEAYIVEEGEDQYCGMAVSPPYELEVKEGKLPAVIRKATKEDIKNMQYQRSQEAESFKLCLQKIKQRNLPMKLVAVERLFSGNKIRFYFTADGRIDFRELVKDLAYDFHTRIEMRQIGVRDEARILGGFGTCGKVLCCCQFLRKFDPITIKMAKEQGLALNPGKISGVCGRLMCCLAYEHSTYHERAKLFPRVGKKVISPLGEGEVKQINVLRGLVVVETEGNKQEFNLNELKNLSGEPFGNTVNEEEESEEEIFETLDEATRAEVKRLED